MQWELELLLIAFEFETISQWALALFNILFLLYVADRLSDLSWINPIVVMIYNQVDGICKYIDLITKSLIKSRASRCC